LNLDAILEHLATLPARGERWQPAVEHVLVGGASLVVPPFRVHELLSTLCSDESIGLDVLFDLLVVDSVSLESPAGVETAGYEVMIAYVLDSSREHHSVTVATRLRTDPTADGPVATALSVCDLFASAAWLEREAYEQHGVTFAGHPAMLRLHLGEETPGYPQAIRRDVAGSES